MIQIGRNDLIQEGEVVVAGVDPTDYHLRYFGNGSARLDHETAVRAVFSLFLAGSY